MTRAAQLAAAGAALCALAVTFAAPELYVPGLSLLLVAIVAPAWVTFAAAGSRLQLRSPQDTAQEADRVTLTLRMKGGWRPLPGATLTLDAPGPPVVLQRPRSGHVAVTVVLRRRGRTTLGPARLALGDPFGICRREVASEACEILVLPRVHAVSSLAGGALAGAPGRRLHAPQPASEIDSLRAYRPGTPASRIHWPTVARTTELVELRLAAESDRRPLVAVDPRAAQSDTSLDEALRAAASLCVHLAGRGGCDLLLPADTHPVRIDAGLRNWPAQHARLAVLTPGTSGPPLGRIAAGGTVLYVTGAPPGAVAIPAGSWRVGPHPLASLPVAFSVAGCAVQLTPGLGVARSA